MYLFLLFISIYDRIIAMEKVLLAIIFILFILFLIPIIICYIKIDITRFNIKNNKIDKDIKIMFLSDLHNRNIYKRLSKIFNSEKPDIIICGGDMVNERFGQTKNFKKIISLFKGYKTYYTFGNHEEALKYRDRKKYIKQIDRTNIILVNNKNISLSKKIKLYGLDIKAKHYTRFGNLCLDSNIIKDYIGKINKENFNILIAHNPLEFDSYVSFGADLVLSGHIHGGVIKIPKLGGLLSPDYTFFPKYYERKYTKDKTTMIVSRGLGFSTKIPFRILNNPEVVVITLKGQ